MLQPNTPGKFGVGSHAITAIHPSCANAFYEPPRKLFAFGTTANALHCAFPHETGNNRRDSCIDGRECPSCGCLRGVLFREPLMRRLKTAGGVRASQIISRSLSLCFQVCTFHDGCKQGIDQQFFNRKSISRKITHPQSLFK